MNAVDPSSFEAVLADVQAELVTASLEYAGDAPSDVYAFGSIEGGAVYFKPFFVVDGQVVKIHQVPATDASGPRQRALLNFGLEQLERLMRAAQQAGRPVPTTLKLHHAVGTGSLDAELGYELEYSEDSERFVTDVLQDWQNEVAASHER